MKKIRLILGTCILSLLSVTIHAQQSPAPESSSAVKLKGVVVDSLTREPLIGATVMIDSLNGVLTNEKGEFNVSGLIKNEDNFIMFNYLGYSDYVLKYKPVKNNNVLTYYVKMQETGFETADVLVTAKAPIAVQLGDTTQYNAAAAKVNPDATAGDLLAKMPGFKVNDDGSAEVQGEAISRLYVDGKSYFKNNPSEGLNTLTADMVESIQLFDEKSDEAKFTGSDDGTRIKTLNIVTKAKKNNMSMGDYSAGYGTDDRYLVRAGTNLFLGDNRFTFNVGSNNLNQGATGMGRRFYGRNRTSGGITSATGASLNYSGEFTKDENRYTRIGFSYRFNHNFVENSSYGQQVYFPTNAFTDRTYTNLSSNRAVSNSHDFSLDFERGFNEKNRLFFRPSASFGNGGSNVLSNSLNLVDGIMSNSANTLNHSRSNNYNISGNLSWMHNFDSKNYLTIGTDYSFSDNNNNNVLIGTNSFYRDQLLIDSLINQSSLNGSNGNSTSLRLSYTRALSDASRINIAYSGGYNWDNSDRRTYLLNPATGLYDDISDALSNSFDRNRFINKVGIGYDYNVRDKITFNVGVDYENSILDNKQIYPSGRNYNYSFNSADVRSRLQLYISKIKFFTFDFSSQSNVPNVSDLQEVVNNDNPLQVSTGNPNLKQSYNSSFRMFYTANNIEKSTSFRVFASVRNQANSITRNSRFLTEDTEVNGVLVQKGAQLTSPVNVNGYWSLFTGANYSFPMNFIKSNLTLELGYNYSRNPSIYNNEKFYSKENAGTFGLFVNSNISENVDFTIGSSTRISYANSSNKNSLDNTYITEQVSFRGSWYFLKNLFATVDYSYNYRHSSTNTLDDPNYHMLSASVGVKFLKSKGGEIRLTGYDLLNQIKSDSHTVNDNYISDTRSTVLTRYFLLTMGYKFNNMKGKGAAAVSDTRGRYMQGPGGPGGNSGGGPGGGRPPQSEGI